MWKKLTGILLAALLAGSAWADEASLRKTIEAAYPKMHVQSITKTPYGGLYEVFLDGQIIYTDEKFSFLIAEGRLVDPKNKRDITSERLEELTRVDFSALPLNQAVKVVKGNGSRKLVVFSDPDCPFCKRLEQNELSGVTDVTIYTFLFPLEQLHPDASNKSKEIWCAPNRAQAWENWILRGQLAQGSTSCETPLVKNAELGKKLAITSTPTLIFSDGRRMLGAYPAQEIEKALDAAAKK